MVTAPSGGGRIVHLRSGDSLLVSAEEVLILARATAGGLDPGDPQTKKELDKFLGLRVLTLAQVTPMQATGATGAASAPAKPPTGPPRAPSDVAPRFLSDLKIVKQANSGLFDVHNPETGKTFQLYDFEVSLARMLDGRRQVTEVLESAVRLGIPVTLDALNQFIRQLERYGFLALGGEPGPAPAEGERMWAPREKWDESLRTLFQSGLRMHRQGRYSEALGYFQVMLEQDPENPEALGMLEQTRQRMRPSAAPRATDKVEKFDELSLADAPALLGPVPIPIPGVPRAHGKITEDLPTLARKARRRRLLVAAGVLTALGVLAAGYVNFRPEPLPPLVSPPVVARPEVPDAAVLPTPVAANAIETLDAAVALGVDAGGAPEDAGEASALVDAEPAIAPAADAGVSPVADDSKVWLTFKIQQRGRVNMGDLRAADDGVLSWKAAAEQRVKRNEVVGSVSGAAGKAELVAPAAGLVIQKAPNQASVTQAQVVGSILYFEAYLKTVVTGIRPEPGWRCEVVSEALKNQAPCKVGSVVPRGAGFFVTATLEPRWFDDDADAVLRLAPP